MQRAMCTGSSARIISAQDLMYQPFLLKINILMFLLAIVSFSVAVFESFFQSLGYFPDLPSGSHFYQSVFYLSAIYFDNSRRTLCNAYANGKAWIVNCLSADNEGNFLLTSGED